MNAARLWSLVGVELPRPLWNRTWRQSGVVNSVRVVVTLRTFGACARSNSLKNWGTVVTSMGPPCGEWGGNRVDPVCRYVAIAACELLKHQAVERIITSLGTTQKDGLETIFFHDGVYHY